MAEMINIKGIGELERKLANLSPIKMKRGIVNASRAAMRPALNAAKASAPVGDESHKTYKGRIVSPGFAKRSLRIRGGVRRNNKTYFADLGVKPEAFYSLSFIELGTKYIPSKPWLTPAFENSRHEILRLFKLKLADQVIKQARKK